VFAIDTDGEVTYVWNGDPSQEPDYDEIQRAVREAK